MSAAQTQRIPVDHDAPVTPDKIMQIALGFMVSKTLLTAVELGLFTELANGPATAAAIQEKLGLNERGVLDFLDSLVSVGLLERTDGVYANVPSADVFLDRKK